MLTQDINNGIIDLNTIINTRSGIFQVEIGTADGDYECVTLASAPELETYMKKASIVERNHAYAIIKDERKGWRTTYIDREGERRYLSSKTKKALIDKLAKIYEEVDSTKTVEDVYNDWLSNKKGTVSDATIERYECDWRRYFVRYGMADRAISLVGEDDLEDYIIEVLKNEKLKTKAYASFKSLIKEIWKRAHKSKATEISITIFFDEFSVPRKLIDSSKPSDYEEVFPDDERDKVLCYLRSHPDTLNRAILLVFLTGLRVGELCALKKTDFVNERYLLIQRTESRVDRKISVVDHTKTEAGNRSVYLCDEAVELVRTLIDDPAAAESEWLLIGRMGHRIVRSCVERRFNQVCEAVEVPKRSVHKIRKTYSSFLIDMGVPERLITEQMGHKDISTTKGYYYFSHLADEVKAARLEKAMKAI